VSPSRPDRTEQWRRGGRFVAVGLANTVATYAIFVLLGLLIPPEAAYTVAFLIGLAWVSLGTSRFVFRSRGRPWRIVSFAAVYLVMYLIGRIIVELLARRRPLARRREHRDHRRHDPAGVPRRTRHLPCRIRERVRSIPCPQ
jgi:hypothetical protein